MKTIRIFGICFMCMAISVQAENHEESKQLPQESAGLARNRPDDLPEDKYRLGALRSIDVKHRRPGKTNGSKRFGYPGQIPQYSPDFLNPELKPANELFPPLSNLDSPGLYSLGPEQLNSLNNLNFLQSQSTRKPNLFNGVYTNQKPYSNYLLPSLQPSTIPSSMIKSGLVPSDGEEPTPCLNSRALLRIFNRLSNLLQTLVMSNNPQLYTVNSALDTLETQLRSGSLKDEELFPKLKVLETQLRQSPLELVPDSEAKLIFNGGVPNIQQPDCKAAFLKLMALAYSAYLQAAEYPDCKVNLPNPLIPNAQSPKAPFPSNEPTPFTPNVLYPYKENFPNSRAQQNQSPNIYPNNPELPKQNEEGKTDNNNLKIYQGQYPEQMGSLGEVNPFHNQNEKSAEPNTNENSITRSKITNPIRFSQTKPNVVAPKLQGLASVQYVNQKVELNPYGLATDEHRQANEDETTKALEQPKNEVGRDILLHPPDQKILSFNPTFSVKSDPVKRSQAEYKAAPNITGNKKADYDILPDSNISPGSPVGNILIQHSRHLVLPERPKNKFENLLRSYPQYQNPIIYSKPQFLNQFPGTMSNPNKLKYFKYYDPLPKTVFPYKPHGIDDLTKNIWSQKYYQNLQKPYDLAYGNMFENIGPELTPRPEFVDLTKKADVPKENNNKIGPKIQLGSRSNDFPLRVQQISEEKPGDVFTLLHNYRPGQKIEIPNLDNDDAAPRNANEEELNANLKHAVQLIENLNEFANETNSTNKFSPAPHNTNNKSLLRDAHLEVSVTSPSNQPDPYSHSILSPSNVPTSEPNLVDPIDEIQSYQPGYQLSPFSLPDLSYQTPVPKYEGLFSHPLNEPYSQASMLQSESPLMYLFNSNQPVTAFPFSDPNNHFILRNNPTLVPYYEKPLQRYLPDVLQSFFNSGNPDLIYNMPNDNPFNPFFQNVLNNPAEINGNDIGGLLAVWFNRDKPHYPPPVINVFVTPECQDFSMSHKLYLMQLLKYFNVLQPGGVVSEQNHELLKMLVTYLKAILGNLQNSPNIPQPDIIIDNPNNVYQVDPEFYIYLDQIIAIAIPDPDLAREVSEALKIYIESLLEQGLDLSEQENINLVLVYLQTLISHIKPLPDTPPTLAPIDEVPIPVEPPALDVDFLEYLNTVLYRLVQDPKLRQNIIMKLEIFIQELITHNFDLRDKKTVDLILKYLQQLILEVDVHLIPTSAPHIEPDYIDIPPPTIDPEILNQIHDIIITAVPITIRNQVLVQVKAYISSLLQQGVDFSKPEGFNLVLKFIYDIITQFQIPPDEPEIYDHTIPPGPVIIEPVPEPTPPPPPEVATISPDYLESLYKLIFSSVRSIELRNSIIVQLQNYIRELIEQGTDWSDPDNLKLLELYVEKLIRNSYEQIKPDLPLPVPPEILDTPIISKEMLHYVYSVLQKLIGDPVQVDLAVSYFHEYVKWAVTVGFDLSKGENLNRLIEHILTLVYQQESPNIPSITESNKLSPASVEITYTLQTKLTYGRDGIVKYRVPYNTFVSNLRDLLLRKPVLRAHQDKLEDELAVATNITAVSPELRDVSKPELIKLIARSGAFVDAKIPKDAIDTQSRDGNNLEATEEFDKMVHQLDVIINKDQPLNKTNKTTPKLQRNPNNKLVLVTHDSISGFDPIAFNPTNPFYRPSVRRGPSNEEIGLDGLTTHNSLLENVTDNPNLDQSAKNITRNENSTNASVDS